MPFLPEPRELEQRAFEDPPPPSRPRLSEEEADEEENADVENETIKAWEKELRKVG